VIAEDARIALLVGSEVVYVAGRGARAATMTPYDVCAVRLADGLTLTGTPPADVDRYLAALRADPGARAVTGGDATVTAGSVADLVERLTRVSWPVAVADARASGALVGAYPAEG
jgi:hypothetical protein